MPKYGPGEAPNNPINATRTPVKPVKQVKTKPPPQQNDGSARNGVAFPSYQEAWKRVMSDACVEGEPYAVWDATNIVDGSGSDGRKVNPDAHNLNAQNLNFKFHTMKPYEHHPINTVTLDSDKNSHHVLIQHHPMGHDFGDGREPDRRPHFHIRPLDPQGKLVKDSIQVQHLPTTSKETAEGSKVYVKCRIEEPEKKGAAKAVDVKYFPAENMFQEHYWYPETADNVNGILCKGLKKVCEKTTVQDWDNCKVCEKAKEEAAKKAEKEAALKSKKP